MSLEIHILFGTSHAPELRTRSCVKMESNSHEIRLTLAKALELSNRPAVQGEPRRPVFLACGFTPLHLELLLKARGRLRFPIAGIEIETSVFDDLIGSLERLARRPGSNAAVVLEWADLDPRLGLRHAGGWRPGLYGDIEREVANRLQRIAAALGEVAQSSVAAVAAPALPLPPLGFTPCAQDTAFELNLRAMVGSSLVNLALMPTLHIVSEQEMALASPLGGRLDAELALAAGFPYSLSHADALASLLIDLLFPTAPRKGLITDLDGTLWRGVLGEVGVENVTWSLEAHAQQHALYQQVLAALAERGILIGIATKNAPEVVAQALVRTDLLCPSSAFFPVEASWEPKSASVARILKSWNIGPEDVVFVDDSPLELTEVSSLFPEMTCLQFPRKHPSGVWELLRRLRNLFGRQIQPEDRIRLASLRAAGPVREESCSHLREDFLKQLKARISIDSRKDPHNTRAFELVNKTNQFNLNGRRWTQGEWQAMLHHPGRFLATVSYDDRLGPLGRIAVVAGRLESSCLQIDTWVMSCRAFSRRIEYRTLASLIAHWSAERIELDYRPTDRNRPFRDFIEYILEADLGQSPVTFTATQYAKRCPPLYQSAQQIDLPENACSPGLPFPGGLAAAGGSEENNGRDHDQITKMFLGDVPGA